MSYGGECFGVTVFPVMGDADGRALTLIIVALLCVLYLTNAHKHNRQHVRRCEHRDLSYSHRQVPSQRPRCL